MDIPPEDFMDRKYRQRGYSDRDAEEKKRERAERPPEQPRPKQQDMLGPRTPRMVGTVMRARCSNCGGVLAPGFDVNGECPRCQSDLHCCKQCVHFDTGKAVRVQPANSRAHCEKGRQEQLHLLRIPHDRREGYLARQLRDETVPLRPLPAVPTMPAKPLKTSSRSSPCPGNTNLLS